MSLQVGQIDIKTLQTVESRNWSTLWGSRMRLLTLQSAHNWPQIIITSPQQSLNKAVLNPRITFYTNNHVIYFKEFLLRISNSICVGKLVIHTNISMCCRRLKFNLDLIGFAFGQMCHLHQPSPLPTFLYVPQYVKKNDANLWSK